MVAISDPTKLDGLDMVSSILKVTIQPVLASEVQVFQAIEGKRGEPRLRPVAARPRTRPSHHMFTVRLAGREDEAERADGPRPHPHWGRRCAWPCCPTRTHRR